jgi:autotransporter-associated beta strand protein
MFHLRHRQARRSASCLAAALVAAFIAISPNSAQADGGSATWNGSQNNNWIPSQTGGNQNWSTGNHLFPGTVNTTTNTDTATFNISGGNPTITLNPSLISGGTTLNVQNITFDTASVGAFTIGTTGGPTLRLTNGGTIQMTSTVANNEIVNAPIELEPASASTAGSYTFLNNASSSTKVLTFGGAISGGTTSSSVTLTLNGSNTGTNTISGVISNGGASGGVAITKSGAGTWVLSGANTYSGDTTISAGILRLGAANRIPDGSGKGNVSVTGTLDLNTFSETINGLSGAGTVDTVAGGTPTFTVGNNDQTSTFSGVIKNTAGTLALTKTGTGTLTLSGANTYSGATNISGGTLSLDNAGSSTPRLANTSTINVNSGGTLLLAQTTSVSTDRINNSAGVTISGGGTFKTGGLSEGTRPTNSGSSNGTAGMGALTLTSTSSGSHATIDFLTGANGSSLVFSSLVGGNGAFLDIKNWTGTAGSDNSATGNDRLLFAADPGLTNAQLANIAFFNDSNVAFTVGGTLIAYGNEFELVPVPEPSTWLAAALALGAVGFSQRKRVRGCARVISGLAPELIVIPPGRRPFSVIGKKQSRKILRIRVISVIRG